MTDDSYKHEKIEEGRRKVLRKKATDRRDKHKPKGKLKRILDVTFDCCRDMDLERDRLDQRKVQ